MAQAFRVDGGVRVQVDRAGRAADDEVRVRVLATENSVQSCHIALPFERIEVMRNGHQVGLRRQLVFRVAPVSFREYAELAGLNEVLHLLLDIAEVPFR
jgi:hypothetical protein